MNAVPPDLPTGDDAGLLAELVRLLAGPLTQKKTLRLDLDLSGWALSVRLGPTPPPAAPPRPDVWASGNAPKFTTGKLYWPDAGGYYRLTRKQSLIIECLWRARF